MKKLVLVSLSFFLIGVAFSQGERQSRVPYERIVKMSYGELFDANFTFKTEKESVCN